MSPGVYDVHSPLVPSVEFMAARIRSFVAAGLLGGDAARIHVVPDCGLKTRTWAEVLPSLRNMVAAAHQARREYEAGLLKPGAAAAAVQVTATAGAAAAAGCAAGCCLP